MSWWTDVRDTVVNTGRDIYQYTSPIAYGVNQLLGPKQQQAPQQDLLKEAQQKYIKGLQEQADKQRKLSEDFSAKAPGLQERAIGAAGDIQRQGAHETIGNINKAASTRGLLYSGLRQGAAAGAVTQSQQNIASQASDIAANIAQQKADLQNQATQANLAVLAAQAGVNNQATDYALKAALTQRQQANQLIGGAGSVAGLGTGLLSTGGDAAKAAPKTTEGVGPGSWVAQATPTTALAQNNLGPSQNQMALWSTGY